MKMETSLSSVSVFVLAFSVLMTWWAWRVLNWVWLRPKKLERSFRQQGLDGNPYRFLFGDLKEEYAMIKQTRSTPIDLTHNISQHVVPFIYQSLKNYGKTTYMWMGPRPRVIITELEHIKDIFSKFNDFHKPSTNPLVKLLLVGLVSKEGQTWAKHRRIINPAFHLDKLKNMLPSFSQCCGEMIERWEELVNSKGSCEVDAHDCLVNLTCDMIARTAFGSSFAEGRKIFQLLGELGSLTVQVASSVYIPGRRFLPTKINKRMKEVDLEIRASLQEIINKREKAMKMGEGKISNNDLLGILMESNLKEIEKHGDGDEKNAGLSIEDVIQECKLFYIAGHESTSVLLTWTMVLLAKHQDWQARAREEVLEIFGDNSKPNFHDFDALNRLKIMQMILYEVLRLYPPISTIERSLHKDTKLGNLIIPTGSHVLVPVIHIHHDRELWGEDADEFNPERFADGVSKATKNRLTFFPFGWGPRICVGQNYALSEAKLVVAMILHNFSLELSPFYTHSPSTVMALEPHFGAQVILRNV